MKIEKFKFNPAAIGKANYVGSEKAPAIIEGKPFDGTRHIVMNAKHGMFSIITPKDMAIYKLNEEVEAIEPTFLEDYVEGTNFSASTNVLAKGLKRVGGNK